MQRRENGDGNPPNDQDPDDDDDDKDSEDDNTPNVNRHKLSGNNTFQQTTTELALYKPGAKLPTLHPKQLYWDSKRARLRLYIQRWYNHLKSFEDYAALMFLQRCVPPNYQDLVLSYQGLVPCLQYLATYCANEEMYCLKVLKEMKVTEPARNFKDGKKLLNLFDNKLVEIVEINRAYLIDFPTVEQLLYRLSSATIRDSLRHRLDEVKAKDDDIYNTNYYFQTLRQLLNIARIQVDEELDTITLNNFSNGKHNQNEGSEFQQRTEDRPDA